MSELSPEQEAQIERDLEQYLADPMPRDLNRAIASRVEAHTMNMYIKHADVMECIHVAWPLIRDYLSREGSGS